MLGTIQTETERKMHKSLETVTHELAGIRSGKATPALLDSIKVEAYGQKTPLTQVASVSVPDPKMLMVQPWDKTIAGNIVKAIQASDMGFNPQSDGNVIRIPVPPLSEAVSAESYRGPEPSSISVMIGGVGDFHRPAAPRQENSNAASRRAIDADRRNHPRQRNFTRR